MKFIDSMMHNDTGNVKFIYSMMPERFGNDHTSMTAPHPVCSVKLSMFGLG